jgi:hypothetical protein
MSFLQTVVCKINDKKPNHLQIPFQRRKFENDLEFSNNKSP